MTHPNLEALRQAWAKREAARTAHAREAALKWIDETPDHEQLISDLETLRAHRNAEGSEWAAFFDQNEADVYTAAERLTFVMRPEADGVRSEAGDFWNAVAGDDLNRDPAAVRAFAETALDRWDSIRPEVVTA